MITEDYVSFAISKLLKEKGFKELTYACFTTDGDDLYGYRAVDNDIMRPTLQMAMRWLRDVYKLCVVVKPYITEEGIFYLFEIMEMNKDSVLNIKAKTGFDTYEEACEAGIKYCLENLI